MANEATLTTDGAPLSRLQSLPAEVQNLITSCGILHRRDLAKVSRVSKQLHTITLAKLYSDLYLFVPMRWSRLGSLENLVGSSGDGLKLTTSIRISTQQDPLRPNQKRDQAIATQDEIELETKLDFCLPTIQASNFLNALVRLLLMKLPQNQLQIFWWQHTSVLDAETVALLLRTQSNSLSGLSLVQPSQSGSIPEVETPGLKELRMLGLHHTASHNWSCRLMARNFKHLRTLFLGNVTRVAEDYAVGHLPRQYSILDWVEGMVTPITLSADPKGLEMSTLSSLGLCGFNLETTISAPGWLPINFNYLVKLVLESCSGLGEAFALLAADYAGKMATWGVSKLACLRIRHEHATKQFQNQLSHFLESFNGLKFLAVSLEGVKGLQELSPILKAHGKTLSTFVWEERMRRRLTSRESTSLTRRTKTLTAIADHCPMLNALGLCLHWDDLIKSTELRPRVALIFKKLQNLQTLNIRNMPEAESPTAWLPTDQMYTRLATMVMDIIASNMVPNTRRPHKFRTIALGAATYADLAIGANHFSFNADRDFLQLRAYHVDYHTDESGKMSSVVKQVAKGIPNDTLGVCKNVGILCLYWLG